VENSNYIPIIEQLRDWGDGFRPRMMEIFEKNYH